MSNLDRERREGLYLKFSEPVMEPHTPVIIERVNGDCTVSKFIIARDEAHELINQLCEFLRGGSPRKVGEDGAPENRRHGIRTWLLGGGGGFEGTPEASNFSFEGLIDYIDAFAELACKELVSRLEEGSLTLRPSSVPVGEQKPSGATE